LYREKITSVGFMVTHSTSKHLPDEVTRFLCRSEDDHSGIRLRELDVNSTSKLFSHENDAVLNGTRDILQLIEAYDVVHNVLIDFTIVGDMFNVRLHAEDNDRFLSSTLDDFVNCFRCYFFFVIVTHDCTEIEFILVNETVRTTEFLTGIRIPTVEHF
jgi:hypothetical protein